MPKYDYKCECGHIWIEEHSIHMDAEELGLICPSCSSDKIKKYLGNMKSMPILFKGAGWYVNDSALDAVGMPQDQRHSDEGRKKLNEVL